MERLPSPPRCGSGERCTTRLPVHVAGALALALVLLGPATVAAQRDPFVSALIGFRLALAGPSGDEGPQILAGLDEMERSLAAWDQTIAAAEQELRARLAGAPTPVALEVHVTLMGLYLERGRLDDALAEVDAAVAIAPDNAAFSLFRGLIQEAAGRQDAAADAFGRAWDLEPGDAVKGYLHAASRQAAGGEVDLQPQIDVLLAAERVGTGRRASFIEVGLIEDRAADWPVFAPAAYAGGFRLIDEGRYEDAIARFRTVSATDPLVAEPATRSPRMAAGIVNFRQNRVAAAIPDFEAGVAEADASSEAHRLLGLAYAADGRAAAAVDHLEAAVRLAPRDERARLALGRTLIRNSQWQAAEGALRATLEMLPESADAHWILADLYDQLDRGQEAIAELEAATTFSLLAGRAQLLWRLADLYHRHQDFAGVTRALSERARLDRNSGEVHKDLGLAYTRRGLQDEALLELLAAILLGQEDAETLAKIGQIHLTSGRHADAERALRRAVALDPSEAQARFALGQTLVRLGREEEGKQELAEFQRLRDEALEQQRQAVAFESLVRDAQRRSGEGRDDLAAEIWEDVIALEPDEPAHRIARAGALSRSGDLEGAVAELERATAMNVSPTVYRQLASLYEKLGRAEDAARAQATFEQLLQQPRPTSGTER
jgi:tetratricopeptide (TPR) repeat protein